MSNETERTAPSVYEHLAMMLDQIASVSWQKLGLQPDIITGKTEIDVSQAKVAIDVAGYLADLIVPHLDSADQRTIQNMVASLRLNFVQKSREANS